MKKLFLFVPLWFLVANVFAVQDRWGSERPAVFRSSRTAAQCDMLLISSGPIHLHAVVVASATLNQGAESRVTFYNSTGGATTLANFNVSTATLLNTNVGQGAPPTYAVNYDMYFSSGLVIEKKGNADVTILWDYVETRLDKMMKSLVPWQPQGALP